VEGGGGEGGRTPHCLIVADTFPHHPPPPPSPPPFPTTTPYLPYCLHDGLNTLLRLYAHYTFTASATTATHTHTHHRAHLPFLLHACLPISGRGCWRLWFLPQHQHGCVYMTTTWPYPYVIAGFGSSRAGLMFYLPSALLLLQLRDAFARDLCPPGRGEQRSCTFGAATCSAAWRFSAAYPLRCDISCLFRHPTTWGHRPTLPWLGGTVAWTHADHPTHERHHALIPPCTLGRGGRRTCRLVAG